MAATCITSWDHELQTGSCLILYGVIGDVNVSTEEQQGLIVHNIYIYLLCAGVGGNGEKKELLHTTYSVETKFLPNFTVPDLYLTLCLLVQNNKISVYKVSMAYPKLLHQ